MCISVVLHLLHPSVSFSCPPLLLIPPHHSFQRISSSLLSCFWEYSFAIIWIYIQVHGITDTVQGVRAPLGCVTQLLGKLNKDLDKTPRSSKQSIDLFKTPKRELTWAKKLNVPIFCQSCNLRLKQGLGLGHWHGKGADRDIRLMIDSFDWWEDVIQLSFDCTCPYT
jgi:hypothetical protein